MIESIEVLKDAASAAIYGAQAGNGVVLVTTKTGNEGTATVTYNGKATLQDFHNRPMMNREELTRYLKYEYGDDWVDSRIGMYDYKHPYYENGIIDTDWLSEYFEPTWSQQHGISFSGGNKNGHFFTSLNYVYDDGVVKGKKDVYKRLTAQVNADYNLFKWLQVGVNNSIEKWNTQSVSQRGYGSSFESVLLMDPLTPVYWTSPDEMSLSFRTVYDALQAGTSDINYRLFRDENGWYANTKYSDMEGSALAKRDATDSDNGGFNINGTFFANLKPIKGLTITSRLGYRLNFGVNHSYSSPYWIGDRGSQKTYSISANASTGWYYQWENFANYLFNIGKNNFTVMAGMSYRETNSDSVNASSSGEDILSSYEPNFRYLSYVLSGAPKSISNSPGKSASLAYFGCLIWNYDNRYQIQANFRADAFDSSKLPANNRWGYFPSVSAYWTISNEQFFKDNVNTNVFNFLKFRASWGRNGNISVLSGYPYTATISIGSSSYQYDVDNMKMISQGPSICVFNKKDPQEVLASWLFAQFLLTDGVQSAYSETEGYVPVTLRAQNSEEYRDYLSREGEDNNAHYDVKIRASKLLIENTSNTFVTPVFNGSTSLRDAAGQMIENVAKSVRRKEMIDDAYLEKLFDDVTALYRLNQLSTASVAGRKDLGPLPKTSVTLLTALCAAWVLIGAYVLVTRLRAKKGKH